MSRSFPCLAALMCLAFGALAAPAAAPTDTDGDPLPPFARLRVGTQRFRTGAPLQALRLLPEQDALLTVDTQQTLRWWDPATGKEIRHFQPGLRGMLSPDGRTLAILEALRDNGPKARCGIRLVNTSTGEVRAVIRDRQSPDRFPPLTFAAGGAVIADLDPGQQNVIRRWRTADGQELPALRLIAGREGQSLLPQGYRFSPDGNRLAVIGLALSGRTAKASACCIWDAASGQFLARLEEFEGRLWRRRPSKGARLRSTDRQSGVILAFSRDGRRVAVPVAVEAAGLQQATCRVRLWEVATGQRVLDLGEFPNGIDSLAFSPDGSTLAVLAADSTQVVLLNLATGKERAALEGDYAVSALAFSPDGRRLVLGREDGTVHLHEVAGGKELWHREGYSSENRGPLPDDPEMAEDFAFTSGGQRLLVNGGLQVRCYRTADGKELPPTATEGHENSVNHLALSADGKRLVTTDGASVRVWDTVTGKLLRRLDARAELLALAPDGQTLAVGQNGGAIQLWDLPRGQELRLLHGHDYKLVSLVFAPDGQTLYSGGWDGRVLAWRLDSDRVQRQFDGLPPGEIALISGPSKRAVAVSPDGKTLAVTEQDSLDCHLHLWEVASGKKRRTFRVKQENDPFETIPVVFAPDGKTLAWTLNGHVHLWDAIRGRELRRFGATEGPPQSAVFSPDGKHLLAVTAEGSVYVWETATGTEVGQMTGHRGPATALAFSANGQVLASGGMDTTVLLWDLPAFLLALERDRK